MSEFEEKIEHALKRLNNYIDVLNSRIEELQRHKTLHIKSMIDDLRRMIEEDNE